MHFFLSLFRFLDKTFLSSMPRSGRPRPYTSASTRRLRPRECRWCPLLLEHYRQYSEQSGPAPWPPFAATLPYLTHIRKDNYEHHSVTKSWIDAASCRYYKSHKMNGLWTHSCICITFWLSFFFHHFITHILIMYLLIHCLLIHFLDIDDSMNNTCWS